MSSVVSKRWTLYILLLQEGKYYVGITSQTPERRFQEHLHGRKSYWTEEYVPIKILQTVDLGGLDLEAAKDYENRVTRRLMREKGVNNVRGGDLTDRSDYIVRFGYVWDRFGWEAITVVTFQAFVILYLIIDKAFISNR